MWPPYLFKALPAGRLTARDYVCEFDHADFERAKESILWHGNWEQQTRIVLDEIAAHKIVRADSTVLDFGCGVGRVAKALRQETGATVAGFDQSLKMLEHARRYLDTVRVDLYSTLPVGPFDAILAIEVLQHIPEAILDEVLPPLRARLKTNGVLFVYGNERIDVDSAARPNSTHVDWVLRRHFSRVEAHDLVVDPQDRHVTLCRA